MAIEFAVKDTGAGRHTLHLIGADHFLMAHAVLVGKFAFENIGNDFHILMRMHAEASARSYPVFIDDA